MLKPAQLYKDKLNEVSVAQWYDMKNIYYHGGPGASIYELSESSDDCHSFVSVDREDNVVGYISYRVDWGGRQAYNFGLISFDKGNLLFIRDCYQVFQDIFEKYHLNRIEWYAYADNPAVRGYRNLCKRFGGHEVGYLHNSHLLLDGKMHDSVMFEICADGYFHREDKNDYRKLVKHSDILSYGVQLIDAEMQIASLGSKMDHNTFAEVLCMIRNLHSKFNDMMEGI